MWKFTVCFGISKKELRTMFEELETKVTKIVDAAEAQQVVLRDIKARLDAIIAGGGLSPEAKAKLTALTGALDTEADDIIAATLENTPAEPPA